MDPNTKDKILDKLTKAENTLIAVSQDSGFDGLASGLALYLSLTKLGKSAQITAKSPSVGEAQRLYGVDKIGQSDGKKTLAIAIENAVENVDKVTYFLDGTKLKVVIHPLSGASPVTKDQLSFEEIQSRPDVVFAVGFKSFEQLRKEVTLEQTKDSETLIVSVSKNKPEQNFAQINFINPSASLSESTGQLLEALSLPLDEDISYNLYAGLAQSTGNFSPAQVSPQSFETASLLVKFGAGRASFARSSSTEAQPAPTFKSVTPIESVELEKQSENDWLKPPKIYKGSKSFDGESKN